MNKGKIRKGDGNNVEKGCSMKGEAGREGMGVDWRGHIKGG